MKKYIALLLALILSLSLIGCRKTVDNCLEERNGELHLVLPHSKSEIWLGQHNELRNFVSYIDYDLLESADKALLNKASQISERYDFYLYMDDPGYLCLGVEIIADGPGQCGDHGHQYHTQRITAQPIPGQILSLFTREDTPTAITVYALPKSTLYTLNQEGINAIMDQLRNMQIRRTYSADPPTHLSEATWEVHLEYADGEKVIVTQYGDDCIRSTHSQYFGFNTDDSVKISLVVDKYGTPLTESD